MISSICLNLRRLQIPFVSVSAKFKAGCGCEDRCYGSTTGILDGNRQAEICYARTVLFPSCTLSQRIAIDRSVELDQRLKNRR